MRPIKISPVLFAIGEFLKYLGEGMFADKPEGQLLAGLGSFIRILTIYLLTKGYILALKEGR